MCCTTPSFTTAANLLPLNPIPPLVASTNSPIFAINSPLPSATTVIFPTAFFDIAQAFITNPSFTETQTISSTPILAKSSLFSKKPGRCRSEHEGLKAAGTPNITTFLPSKSLDESMVRIAAPSPSGTIIRTCVAGIRSLGRIAHRPASWSMGFSWPCLFKCCSSSLPPTCLPEMKIFGTVFIAVSRCSACPISIGFGAWSSSISLIAE
mmetsp:Transcript_43874/g.68664  ORF Transcript_43874/g.68664 Transcript_43874/m.68664 type:complete len:209 (+) Transcript_43874:805-1431(+)